jgi:hypothetical protein
VALVLDILLFCDFRHTNRLWQFLSFQRSDTTTAPVSLGAVRISEATRRHVPEDGNPHSHHRENLKRFSELFDSGTFENTIVFSRNETQSDLHCADLITTGVSEDVYNKLKVLFGINIRDTSELYYYYYYLLLLLLLQEVLPRLTNRIRSEHVVVSRIGRKLKLRSDVEYIPSSRSRGIHISSLSVAK